MTEDQYTDSLSRLSLEETRRVIALDMAVRSLSQGHDPATVIRRADTFAEYLRTARWP